MEDSPKYITNNSSPGTPRSTDFPGHSKFAVPDFDEVMASQLPALLQLLNLGYTYLSRKEVRKLRESSSQYILRDIAFKALRSINSSKISDKSIQDEIFKMELQIDLGKGVFKASEEIYSTLLSGCGVSELIDGRRTSPHMFFIDWRKPENNLFHVCAEFPIGSSSEGKSTIRADVVLFVNGIPFVVIENKRPSVKVAEAVAQMVRNQSHSDAAKFFLFAQILIATNSREFRYGTMKTPPRFFSRWREKDVEAAQFNAEVEALINRPVPREALKKIADDFAEMNLPVESEPRSATEQDRGIYSLLRPDRLLDLVRNFILYDNNEKKIARYQQYFAIRKSLERLKTFDEFGRRRGGLIWHTQGSGKSLTMVMLVKCLIDDPEIILPRILVVTDRRDLDRQISDTFAACNIKKEVRKTRSSSELLELIRNKDQRVITALIQKFDAGKALRDFVDDDPNIFVLIDEAHRSQSGQAGTELELILPKACRIAFTGTPLMRREKLGRDSTSDTEIKKITETKFGGMIDSYTISEAERDGVVLPLIYQPRFVVQSVQQRLLDEFYDNLTKALTQPQKEELQQRFNSSQIIEETSQRIETIALDIVKHYSRFENTGLKAQVVAPSKYAAIMFQAAFTLCRDEGTQPLTAVIVSDTNDKEADDLLPEHKRVVARFLDDEKRCYGSSLLKRERKLIHDFKHNPKGVRMLIVVDKLLTGFDAPRNTFLYLAKQLTNHNLLQAVARVNRLFDGDEGKEAKVNGFVIDYSKNAQNLKDAMELFSKYDPEDIERALLNTDQQFEELEKVYQRLIDIFKGVRNRESHEEYIRTLEGNLETRERFYDLVDEFTRRFSACQCLYDFTQKVDAEKIRRYAMTLKSFVELKKIQKTKNAETVDFSKYEDQIRRILDKYVTAEYVTELAEPLYVSETAEFNAYIENTKRGLSERSRAEAIAAQTGRIISEKYNRDPEFYQHFSEKINQLLIALKAAKEEDVKALLVAIRTTQGQVVDYEDNDIPADLKPRKPLHPYYRNLRSRLEERHLSSEQLARISVKVHDLIESHKIVDWDNDIEVERRVRIELEDYLFDVVNGNFKAGLPPKEIEAVVSMVWDLAVENKGEGESV